jgi:hypothetical protein
MARDIAVLFTVPPSVIASEPARARYGENVSALRAGLPDRNVMAAAMIVPGDVPFHMPGAFE